MAVRRLGNITAAFAAAFLTLLCCSSPAMATDPPDSVSIYDIGIYTYLIEEDDFLAIVPYSINFGTAPDDDISEAFLFSLIDTDNSTRLGSALAYPYTNDGYGDGIVSFYFSADNAPDWGESYRIKVEENPAVFDSPIHWTFLVTSAGYSTYTTQDDNRELLRTGILDIAEDLTTSWGIDLTDQTDTGTVLSTYGESYFRLSIWGLQSMCPNLFYSQILDPDYTERSWDTTFAEALVNTFAGTFIWDAMTGFAGMWGMDDDIQGAMAFLVVGLLLLAFAGYHWKFDEATPSWLSVPIVLNFGMLMGWFSPILRGLISFIFVAAGATVQFLNRS